MFDLAKALSSVSTDLGSSPDLRRQDTDTHRTGGQTGTEGDFFIYFTKYETCNSDESAEKQLWNRSEVQQKVPAGETSWLQSNANNSPLFPMRRNGAQERMATPNNESSAFYAQPLNFCQTFMGNYTTIIFHHAIFFRNAHDYEKDEKLSQQIESCSQNCA